MNPVNETLSSRQEDQTSFSKFTNSGRRAARLLCSETLSRSETIIASRELPKNKVSPLPKGNDMTPCQWSTKPATIFFFLFDVAVSQVTAATPASAASLPSPSWTAICRQ